MPLPDHVKVRRECLSFVVLGATGNLAQKKLLPSLFNLFANGHLPARTLIVCGGRPAHTAEQFNEITSKSLREFLENASAGRATHEKDTTDVKPFRHPSLAAGFDDLDLDFRASLGDEPSAAKKTILLSQKQKHSPPPLPPPTTRDIGGCAVTSRKSSFVNLVDLDQQGNTDDDASSSRAGANQSPQKTQSKLKPRFGNAAGVAKSQSAPEFLIADFLERVRYACVPTFGNVDDANDNLRDVFGLVTEHELKNADAPGKNRLYYLASTYVRLSRIPPLFYLSAGDCYPYIAIYKTDTFFYLSQCRTSCTFPPRMRFTGTGALAVRPPLKARTIQTAPYIQTAAVETQATLGHESWLRNPSEVTFKARARCM
jgi:hypothetical protein